MDPESRPTRPALITIVALAILVMVVWVGVRRWSRTEPEENPFALDLERYSHVDPALIGYREGARIPVGLEELRGLAVDGEGRILVVGDTAVLILRGTEIVARLELAAPARCVAVDATGRILVGMTDHVEVLSHSGERLASWPPLGEKAIITSIAAAENEVWVADAGAKVVWRFDHQGTVTGRIDGEDAGQDEPGFVIPSPYFDVAIGYEGLPWVVDSGRHTLENYTRDGELRSSWGRSGATIDGFCGCCNPTHIAILGDGSFVTSEKGLPRVKVFRPNGELAMVVAAPRDFAEGTVGLDLAVDEAGRIHVLDPKARAVRVYTAVESR